MLVVDASCLYEVVADAPLGERIRGHLARDPDHAAPQIVDVEVMSVVRREHLLGRLDATAARQAVEDLREWPGERFGHRPLLGRAWELRANVRPWDAMYVALAEVLGGTVLTLDARLGHVEGLGCPVVVVR
jgi:predicted nucleic acid-binding protein